MSSKGFWQCNFSTPQFINFLSPWFIDAASPFMTGRKRRTSILGNFGRVRRQVARINFKDFQGMHRLPVFSS
jgi:hypothetical protein